MANKIQVRRGLKANLPILSVGEPALVTNSGAEEIYIGTGAKNIQLARQDEMKAALDNKVDKGLTRIKIELSEIATDAVAEVRGMCLLNAISQVDISCIGITLNQPLVAAATVIFYLPVGFRPVTSSRVITCVIRSTAGASDSRVGRVRIDGETGRVDVYCSTADSGTYSHISFSTVFHAN